MLVFISGGVRSGKSTLGEKLTDDSAIGRKVYLATSIANDEEMANRIRLHQEQRKGRGYLTIEKSTGIHEITTDLLPGDTVLLDCLGNLLANEMFIDENTLRTADIVDNIFLSIKEINDKVENLIIISNDVFSDGCMYSDSVVEYIDALAALHIRIAGISDKAIECVFGNAVAHKT